MREKIKDTSADTLGEEEYFPTEEKKEKASKLFALGYAFIAFGFSQLSAVGELSPFTAAFLCCVPYDFVIPCFLLGAAGYLISSEIKVAVTYISILLLCALVRLIINKFTLQERRSYGFAAIPFVSTLLIKAVILFFRGFNIPSVLFLLLEGVLTLLTCLFFLRDFRIPLGKVGISQLNPKDSTCLTLSFCVFLMSFSGFTLEGISPARIIAAMLVLLMAFYKGASAGAVTGICVGAALCIDPAFRFLFPCYALAGLIAAVFSSFGQIVTGVVFGAAFALCSLMGGESNGLICLAEGLVACVCFVLLPQKWLSALQDFLHKFGFSGESKITTEVSASLHSAANNIYSVAKIVGNVCERLDGVINPEVNKLFTAIQQNVCDGCENKNKCWNKMFDITARDIMVIAGIEKRTKARLPIEKRCERQDSLKSSIRILHREYLADMATKMKLREMRKVLTDQFCGMGDFLTETANKVQYSRSVDTARSVSLRTALTDSGIFTDALSFFTDCTGRVTIEAVLLDQSFESDTAKMKTILEFMTRRKFEKAEITVTDVRTTIAFREKARYSVQIGFSQKPLVEGTLCGDTVRVMNTPEGQRCAVISDGMGTGSRAAIDSTMTASIMEKLISVGFSFSGALKIVNSAMIMKSTDESMATVDAVSVNVYNGTADFFKAGAAVSFIRSGKQVYSLQKQSLPIGIIRNVSFAAESYTLEEGDIILLLSDGVTGEDCGWIGDELLAWSTNNMEGLAKHIVNLASLRSDEGTRDDLTAVAVKLERNS